MRLLAAAIVLTGALSSSISAADSAMMRHFTIAKLREACGSEHPSAVAFCRGFLTAVFEMATVFDGSLGGGLCPRASIDAKSLRALAVGAMGGNSAVHDDQPAVAFLLDLYGKQFPCSHSID